MPSQPGLERHSNDPILYRDSTNLSYDASPDRYLARPLTSLSQLPTRRQELSLDEAIEIALQDTEILRSLAATAVRNATAAASSFDPAIQSTDPNFGIEAALAQFDANLTANAIYANNDDFFNNASTTGGAFEVQQDLVNTGFGVNKTTVAGTQLAISSSLEHDNSTNPSYLFPSSWTSGWEATARHPFLQGSGVQFNRIAGPTSRPGFLGTNGLLISQSNHDISVVQFERGVREMIIEIVDAYWELELAYKNLTTIEAARDASLETWNIAKARFNQGLEGGEADREAQAREQYFLFQTNLAKSLNGTQADGSPGVLQAEANLRRLLNLPQSEDFLFFPTDVPVPVATVLSWNDLVDSALNRRAEIKEQETRVRQDELFLIASRNFTKPRLDGIATYRNNGFGDDLINNAGKFSGALNEAYSGNYDEWEFGFAFEMPIGFRQAQAGIRNAQLKVIRQKALLNEIQKQILHEMGTALRVVDQSFMEIELARNRSLAAEQSLKSRQAAYKADTIGFEDLLDAQQRYLDAKLQFHRTKTNYEIAHERLYSESGMLLAEHQVLLAEEPQ